MARPTLYEHRKFRRLARMLGSQLVALGALEFLWASAYQAGDDYLGDADDVEAAARWDGEPGRLFKALLEAGGPKRPGFIEPAADGDGYQVRDLWDHAPDYVRRRRHREDLRRSTGKKYANGDRSVSGQCPVNDPSVALTRTRTRTPSNVLQKTQYVPTPEPTASAKRPARQVEGDDGTALRRFDECHKRVLGGPYLCQFSRDRKILRDLIRRQGLPRVLEQIDAFWHELEHGTEDERSGKFNPTARAKPDIPGFLNQIPNLNRSWTWDSPLAGDPNAETQRHPETAAPSSEPGPVPKRLPRVP